MRSRHDLVSHMFPAGLRSGTPSSLPRPTPRGSDHVVTTRAALFPQRKGPMSRAGAAPAHHVIWNHKGADGTVGICPHKGSIGRQHKFSRHIADPAVAPHIGVEPCFFIAPPRCAIALGADCGSVTGRDHLDRIQKNSCRSSFHHAKLSADCSVPDHPHEPGETMSNRGFHQPCRDVMAGTRRQRARSNKNGSKR